MMDRERLTGLRVTLFRVALAAAVILFAYGSLSADAPGPKWGPGASVTHLLVAVVLGLLCRLASRSGRSALWMVGAIALATVAAEAVQLLVPARQASILDAVAGLVGLAIGYPLGRLADMRLQAARL